MFKDNVSVEELRALLVARTNADEARNAAIQNRIHEALDSTVPTEDPYAIAIMARSKLINYLADIVARRMKMRRRAHPLVSLRDISKFTPSLIEFIEESTSERLTDEEGVNIKTFVNSSFGNLLEAINKILPAETNLYDSYWKWVETVFAVAKERNVSPVSLYQSDGADEVTRRLFTKDQFTSVMKKAMSKGSSIRTIYRFHILPFINLEAGNDRLLLKRLKLQCRLSTLPIIRENIAKTKPVMRAIIREEITRIYGK